MGLFKKKMKKKDLENALIAKHKPCPFCKGKIMIVCSVYRNKNIWIKCAHCESTGPAEQGIIAALASWDSRS